MSLSNEIYLQLKRMIGSLELRPGQVLQSAALAARFGVSRSPVRDALNRLADEGLVTVRPQASTVVTEFAARDFLESLEVRLALELHAVRLASIPKRKLDLDAARTLLRELERLFPTDASLTGALSDYNRLNYQFHRALLAAAGNSQLIDTYDSLNMPAYFQVLVRTENAGERILESHSQHEKMLRLLELGDTSRLQALLRRHVRPVQRTLLSVVESADAPSLSGRANGLAE